LISHVLNLAGAWTGDRHQDSLTIGTAPRNAGTLEQTSRQSGYQANNQEFH